MAKITLTDEEKDTLANEWEMGISPKLLATKYNMCKDSVYKIARDRGKNREKITCRKYTFNYDFFNEIKTERQAYWLGFITADGFIKQNSVVLKLSGKDKTHLLKLQYDIEDNSHIIQGIEKEIYPFARLCLTHKNIVNDLYGLNVAKQKTSNEKFPFQIPGELYRHYIRGYFDGDGTLYIITNKKSKNESIVFSICCANLEFLSDIQNILIKECHISKNQIYNKDKKGLYILQYGGNKQCSRICNYLWEDTNIYLPRKIIPIVNSNLLKEPIAFNTCLEY